MLGAIVDALPASDGIRAFSRAGAWSHGEALWALRGSDLLSTTFLDALDGLVGFASRGLLISV